VILIVLSYLAGVLTILSPCILPVLPFVFSRSQKSFLRSGLPLLLGMSLTFSFFSGLAIVGGEWISHASEIGRIVAMVILTVVGLSLLLPDLSEKILAPLTRVGSKIGGGEKEDSFGGSVIIGISTGLLWAPCAGPILGLVLTGAASQGNAQKSIILLIAYSLGAATSLGLALVAGNRFLGTLKKFLKADLVVKKTLGALVLLGVIAIALNLDRTVLTQISKLETASLEAKLLEWAHLSSRTQPNGSADLSAEGEMPELQGAVAWLNSKSLTKEALKGKVVVVDFWTYSCINCLRSLPYFKAWAEKYKNDDVVFIGVHTPEFAFEKNTDNVRKAIEDFKITYPVAVDSNYAIWNAFQNEYWPAHYFIDREGKIRHHHFGEGGYDESDEIIRKLITENGHTVKALTNETTQTGKGVEAPDSQTASVSPETYVGFGRAENLKVTPGIRANHNENYVAEKNLAVNQWSLNGSWNIEEERAVSTKPGSRIIYRFKGRDLHLVLGSQKPVKFRVKIDGANPKDDHGMDIDENGNGVIESHKLYQLIRLQNYNPHQDHVFEIEFLNDGAEAYAFTFG
jgi:cytochrome c biogenesis protein CcdA/thiol-disulfide isomerase/thioredoxin